VQYDLAGALVVSASVKFNGNGAFTMASNSGKVTGDEAGTAKGVSSGTVSAMAEPIEHSPSVKINGEYIVRCGDKFYMNSKNTTGSLTCSAPGSAPPITDDGQIESDCGGE
jgi:hypothetical protein